MFDSLIKHQDIEAPFPCSSPESTLIKITGYSTIYSDVYSLGTVMLFFDKDFKFFNLKLEIDSKNVNFKINSKLK